METPKNNKTSNSCKFKPFDFIKNIIIISIAFCFNFTSYNAVSHVQSSLYDQMGTTALGILYVAMVLSSAIIPSILIKRLGIKWTMVVSIVLYSPYYMAMFKPSYATLIPGAVSIGVAAGPLWIAKCTYFTKLSVVYSKTFHQPTEVILSRFFGILFLFFQSTQIWANIFSSTVLSSGVQNFTKSESQLQKCGADFCLAPTHIKFEDDSTVIVENDEQNKVNMIIGVCIALTFGAAFFIAVFADSLNRFTSEKEEESKSVLHLLLATTAHLKNPYQILILPLTIYSGIEQAFFSSDFTAACISCALGVHMVGYIFIAYGVTDALGSILVSYIVKRTGRIPVYALASLLNCAALLILIFWKPRPDAIYVFYTVSVLWGLSDAVWQTQINSLYGILFPSTTEAAFSNYRLWESVGMAASYFFANFFCFRNKIFIVFAFLAVAMAGYVTIEVMERKKRVKYRINTK